LLDKARFLWYYLSSDDIEHYRKIVVAINETIKIMGQIDETIEAHGGWSIEYNMENLE
jgi:hypothetical protein